MINIYVGNLPTNTTEQELQTAFEAFGEVSAVKIIKDRFTGEPRGFAFVEMPDEAAGKEAIKNLNDQDFNGKLLKVNEARPRTERRDDRRGGFGGGGNRGGGFGGGRGRGSRF